MSLDIHTLIFVMAVSSAIMFFLIGASYANCLHEPAGISSWLWSYAAQSIGWCLFLMRGIAPDWISIVVANTLLIIAAILIYRAIRDFLERPIPLHISILTSILFLLVFAYLYAYVATQAPRIIWISVVAGIVGLACAWELLHGIHRRTASARWATGMMLGLGGVILLTRALIIFISPTHSYDLFTQSHEQVIAFIVTYSSVLGASFGFNLMAQERTLHKLEKIARLDELTGMFNRRHLFDSVRHELNRMKRANSKSLVLMMIDIDNFKEINDQYGHAVGDELLKCFAGELSGVLRAPDILGRYGGEEFCVLLPDTNLSMGLQVAERLRIAAYNANVTVGNQVLRRTISIGVAHSIEAYIPHLDELFQVADQALYQAKAEGRNRIVVAEKKAADKPTNDTINDMSL